MAYMFPSGTPLPQLYPLQMPPSDPNDTFEKVRKEIDSFTLKRRDSEYWHGIRDERVLPLAKRGFHIDETVRCVYQTLWRKLPPLHEQDSLALTPAKCREEFESIDKKICEIEKMKQKVLTSGIRESIVVENHQPRLGDNVEQIVNEVNDCAKRIESLKECIFGSLCYGTSTDYEDPKGFNGFYCRAIELHNRAGNNLMQRLNCVKESLKFGVVFSNWNENRGQRKKKRVCCVLTAGLYFVGATLFDQSKHFWTISGLGLASLSGYVVWRLTRSRALS